MQISAPIWNPPISPISDFLGDTGKKLLLIYSDTIWKASVISIPKVSLCKEKPFPVFRIFCVIVWAGLGHYPLDTLFSNNPQSLVLKTKHNPQRIRDWEEGEIT